MTPATRIPAADRDRPRGGPSVTRVAGLTRHNLKLWLGDVQVPILLLGMPLAMMAFLRPVYRDTLAGSGFADASGAEQAVPGMAVMFALLGAGILAADLHREKMWGTWERLRASGARTSEIITGKLLPPLLLLAGQLAVLFTAGTILFDLPLHGSLAGLVLVAAAFAIAMTALGTALSATIRSITALGAVGNAASVALAGLGGAIVPLSVMPEWAAALAPATPSYWAMRGFQAAIFDSGGLTTAATSTLALLAMATILGAIASWRFRRSP